MTENNNAEKQVTPASGSAIGDYTRYVQFLYLFAIAISTWLLDKIISSTWSAFGEPIRSVVLLSSISISVIIAIILWRHEKVKKLAFEVITELSKVTWPSKKELYAAVVTVIIVSIIVSIILFLFDAFWSWATTKIYLL